MNTVKKTITILSVVVALAYVLLIGAGAYLQFSSGKQFDDLKKRSDAGESISVQEFEEYQQSGKLSENLKKAGRTIGYISVFLFVLFVALRQLNAKQASILISAAVVLGLLVALPWCLKSGDSFSNYYIEQLFVLIAGVVGIAASFLVSRTAEKK